MTYTDSLKTAIHDAANALLPPPRTPLAEWTAKNFRLSSEASAITGEFRPLPFQTEPLDCMAPHSPYEQVCLMWASQLSKTTLTLAFLANVMVEDPGPCLVVQPNLQMAEVWSKQRLGPMCRDMPVLKGIVSDPKSRDSGSTVFSRSFRGGHVSVASAGSPAGLASRPIRYLILDEVDRFEASAGAEGSPSSLAIVRTRSFRASRKILWTSSPTVKDASEVEAVYAESDQREYEVPCPHCGFFQVLVWSRVEWPEDDELSAFYRCAGCSEDIQHHLKVEMVLRGRWVARNPGAAIAGFHLSELVSPFRSWGELAVDWRRAQGNVERLRAFINTSLAELWDDEATGTATETELMARRESFGPMLPERAAILTAGVDVQDNRLEVSVYAWTAGEESWLMSHRVFPGDPSTPGVWAAVDAFLLEEWQHPLIGPVPIHAAAVDSGGHFTNAVYRFCEDRRGRRVFAVKGMAGARPIWPRRESKVARGKVFVIGVDSAKQTLQHRLKLTDGPGVVHYPLTVERPFFEQLNSEYLRTVYKHGRPERTWERRKGRAAEAWDCAVYAYAALQGLASLGIHVDVEAAKLELVRQTGAVQAARPRVTRSRWMDGVL